MRETEAMRPGLPALAAVLGVVFFAAAASGETITLRWRHAAPERVAGFRVHTGPAPGVYTQTIDVGRPASDADGTFHVRVDVADGQAAHVAISAYDAAGAESARSNEWVRPSAAGALGTPGRPEVVEP